jgi:hypothetical protein
MVAATPPELFSSLYKDPSKWETMVPVFDVLVNRFGSGVGVTDDITCHDGLVQTGCLSLPDHSRIHH